MPYYFDDYGWLSETPIPGRETEVAPPSAEKIPAGSAANFTGYTWVVVPYVPPPPPDPNAEARALGLQLAMHLDLKVREREYDDMKAAVTYAMSTVPRYRADGLACLEWRDAAWVQFEQILEQVQSGARPLPTYDELIAELPALEWPS